MDLKILIHFSTADPTYLADICIRDGSDTGLVSITVLVFRSLIPLIPCSWHLDTAAGIDTAVGIGTAVSIDST